MPKNLEVKARTQRTDAALNVARSLPASFEGTLFQVDTYFRIQHGRLKLREINQKQAELIYYNRPEDDIQRISDFEIYPCSALEKIKSILEQSLGILTVVTKERQLFLYQSTRIHIDEVENLGSFIEFEVPLIDSMSEAKKTMNFLIDKFGIKEADYELHSYLDLMQNSEMEK